MRRQHGHAQVHHHRGFGAVVLRGLPFGGQEFVDIGVEHRAPHRTEVLGVLLHHGRLVAVGQALDLFAREQPVGRGLAGPEPEPPLDLRERGVGVAVQGAHERGADHEAVFAMGGALEVGVEGDHAHDVGDVDAAQVGGEFHALVIDAAELLLDEAEDHHEHAALVGVFVHPVVELAKAGVGEGFCGFCGLGGHLRLFRKRNPGWVGVHEGSKAANLATGGRFSRWKCGGMEVGSNGGRGMCMGHINDLEKAFRPAAVMRSGKSP
jgi:hypothetical protein